MYQMIQKNSLHSFVGIRVLYSENTPSVTEKCPSYKGTLNFHVNSQFEFDLWSREVFYVAIYHACIF